MATLKTPVPYGVFNDGGTVQHNVRICALTGAAIPQGGVIMRVTGTQAFFRLTGNARRKISNAELHAIRENIRDQVAAAERATVIARMEAQAVAAQAESGDMEPKHDQIAAAEAESGDTQPNDETSDSNHDEPVADGPLFVISLPAENFDWCKETIMFFRLTIAEDLIYEVHPYGRGQKAVIDWMGKNAHGGETPVRSPSVEPVFVFDPDQPVSNAAIQAYLLELDAEQADADDAQ